MPPRVQKVCIKVSEVWAFDLYLSTHSPNENLSPPAYDIILKSMMHDDLRIKVYIFSNEKYTDLLNLNFQV